MDLRPVMNPTPSIILASTPLPQIFRRFRSLGMVRIEFTKIYILDIFSQRHMLVCNDNNEVVGLVTRKDLARFRVVHHGSRMARYNTPVTIF